MAPRQVRERIDLRTGVGGRNNLFGDTFGITAKVFDQLWSDADKTVFQTAGSNGGNEDGDGYGYSKLVDFETSYDLQAHYPDELDHRDTLALPRHVGGKRDGNGRRDGSMEHGAGGRPGVLDGRGGVAVSYEPVVGG